MTCFDFLTNFLTSWRIFDCMTNFWHIFVARPVLDVMKNFRTSWRTCWRHDKVLTLFEVITNLLSSWCVFDIFTNFLTSWRVYDIMTNFWFDKHLDVKTYVALMDAMELFDDMRHFLTSRRNVRPQTNFLRYGVFFYIMTNFMLSWRISDDITSFLLFCE